jgi:hypothetical protein
MFCDGPGKDTTGIFDSNSHPASEYMTNSRLIDPTTPIEQQVCRQVYGASPTMSFSAATIDPRNPAGWPTTTDLFPSLLRKSTR